MSDPWKDPVAVLIVAREMHAKRGAMPWEILVPETRSTWLEKAVIEMKKTAEPAECTFDLLGLESCLVGAPLTNVGIGKKTALGLIARIRRAEAALTAVRSENEALRKVLADLLPIAERNERGVKTQAARLLLPKDADHG